MMTPWLFHIALENSQPSTTFFSVEPTPGCTLETVECPDSRRSSFYGGWVRVERPETRKRRLELAMQTLERAITELTCVRMDGSEVRGCEVDDVIDPKRWKRWTPVTLAASALGVAIIESGLREDVMVGRGRSGKPSDDGGEGRGPANEGCYVQQNPRSAWRWVSPEDGGVDQATIDRAAKGDRGAREAVIASLLGGDADSVTRCWKTGLRALAQARWYCGWSKPQLEWTYSMVSMFGTGDSCSSPNQGKTKTRQRIILSLIAQMSTAKRNAGKS